MPRQHRIAAIPADGIGPEVIAAGLEVLEAVAARDGGFTLKVDHYDWGSDYYRKHGRFMPADALAWLRTADAIYFGAVGDPDIPDHVTLWGLRLPICQGLDQYANVRPTRILPGVTSPLRDVGPGDLDWVIVRENSEGEYAGQGGRSHRGFPEEVATEVAIFTRRGVERIMRYAFALARRPPGEAPDRRHQVQRPAPRHGVLGRDGGAGLARLSRCGLGTRTGRCDDHAHGAQAGFDRHRGGDQPARRYPVRPGGGAGRLAGHRTDGK